MNARGFTFPVTLCILLLFSSFLAVHFQQYVMEKRFQFELAEFERNQFMFLQSLKKVETLLSTEEQFKKTGQFHYENGTVTYQIEELGPGQLQISFRLFTSSQGELTGVGYFDQELQKMVKWTERN
ncbi:competence type IV pilus minor pilin ComGG [Robertmurraya sp. DFI.2.37]|uniref:competence type IV pilus minor pilin ComGG n=1 Tax=Robertmurraya sp. DFI.2.37 TaxID=3031819 RepID=UPI001246EDBB|nr:competence type IV pilus minor pilin ComGG [Robertmurraya sp. DFI.2.37]MDF1507602.1 competence type IV pilus minor pilin ComGG [Robertmurraya sp. DFI.2.37]